MLLHREASTHRLFYTTKLLHTDAFTHTHLHTQRLLHTDAFTHRRFYTEKLLHTEAFTAFTQRHVYTQTRLHRCFYTKTRLHTETFTHRHVYTQSYRGGYKFAILPQFLAIEPHFVRKGCRGTLKITNLPQLLAIELHFVCCRGHFKPQFYLSFWRSNFISCERVAAAHSEWQFYVSFWRSNLISCERISAEVVKSQFYVSFWRSCRLVGTAPRLQKRNRKEGESKRATEQEGKRAREQEGKRECEDVKMRREDVKMRYDEMWRWEDVKIWGCEDVKMFDRPPLLEEPFAQTLSGKIADKSLLQPWCSHSNTAKKPTVLSTQPRLQATLTQPLQCDLQRLSCEAQKNYAQRRQKSGAFRARLPLKRKIWRCENEAFVRDLPEKVKVQDKAEDVKTKLSCETCLKSESGRCENEAFVRDLPEKVRVEDVKTKLSCETCLKKWKCKMWKRSFRARLPWQSESGRCENEAFVRDLPEKVKVQDVKTKLSCETCLKKWKWKMWKRSFRARLAWKGESGRCENEAFVRDLPEKVKVQDVKAKLSCETFLKIWTWKMWKRSFRARLPYCYSVVVIVVMLWLWWYCHSGDVVIVVILS